MVEKLYATPCGEIHYWTNKKRFKSKMALVFLPGLTADHRLFDKQIEYFEKKCKILVWDAPEHAASWPFDPSFDSFQVLLCPPARAVSFLRVSFSLPFPGGHAPPTGLPPPTFP